MFKNNNKKEDVLYLFKVHIYSIALHTIDKMLILRKESVQHLLFTSYRITSYIQRMFHILFILLKLA
jgi:uncharacterized protein (DUF488 family)